MENLRAEFEKAAKDVTGLASRPGNDDLLALYALYKQATEGDVKGSRPGLLDIKGRKKYDSWAEKKGVSSDAAMKDYISLVKRLQGR